VYDTGFDQRQSNRLHLEIMIRGQDSYPASREQASPASSRFRLRRLGENAGFISVIDLPYAELVKSARVTHRSLNPSADGSIPSLGTTSKPASVKSLRSLKSLWNLPEMPSR